MLSIVPLGRDAVVVGSGSEQGPKYTATLSIRALRHFPAGRTRPIHPPASVASRYEQFTALSVNRLLSLVAHLVPEFFPFSSSECSNSSSSSSSPKTIRHCYFSCCFERESSSFDPRR